MIFLSCSHDFAITMAMRIILRDAASLVKWVQLHTISIKMHPWVWQTASRLLQASPGDVIIHLIGGHCLISNDYYWQLSGSEYEKGFPWFVCEGVCLLLWWVVDTHEPLRRCTRVCVDGCSCECDTSNERNSNRKLSLSLRVLRIFIYT